MNHRPFTPPALEEIIRDELEELNRRPEDPRLKEELRESFRLYRHYKPVGLEWQHHRGDWVPCE